MNRLKILLFAGLKDALGVRAVELEIPERSTVADLKNILIERYPRVTPWKESLKVAVNHEYAADGDPVPDSAEVALIPPVSGG